MDNKITVEIGSYKVTVNSVEEARNLMGMTREEVSKSPTKGYVKKADRVDSDEHVIKINKKLDGRRFNGGNNKHPKGEVKTRKSTPGSRWLPEEVQYILDNQGLGSKAITESQLRSRHSRMGIQQMFWKASRNPKSYKVRPEIQEVISAFHNR